MTPILKKEVCADAGVHFNVPFPKWESLQFKGLIHDFSIVSRHNLGEMSQNNSEHLMTYFN